MPKTKDFKKLQKNVAKTYLGKKVPAMYRSKYGKVYDSDEVKSLSYAIARVKGIKIDSNSYSRRTK